MQGVYQKHERLRRTGDVVCPKLNLTLEMKIPMRDSVMRSDHNKKELINVFCNKCNSPKVLMVGVANSEYKHEEADCNIISYVKYLINQGYTTIQVVVV